MKRILVNTMVGMLLLGAACEIDDDNDGPVVIPDFNFPQTVTFEEKLSSYGIFQDPMVDLNPVEQVQLLELSSVLFTDYAHKQRLIKLPDGTQMTRLDDGSIDFPDGTILIKTFYYLQDERDPNSEKQIIETRLLIKEADTWNAATYVWNDAQTEAQLEPSGLELPISWVAANGANRSIVYAVPSENDCGACHQSNDRMRPIGPTLRNLNRTVERDGVTLNQLEHLQSQGVLSNFPVSEAAEIVDYMDVGASLASRGRAYLAMNCSHCHNPNGWDIPAQEDFDFRYETPFGETGISGETDDITEVLIDEEMPFIGTTIKDDEGVSLLLDYLDSL